MINRTQLNKLRSLLDKNKMYIESREADLKKMKLWGDEEKRYTIALSMSVLMEYFKISQFEAFDSITEGGDDNKIDALYYSDDESEISELVIVQSKYKVNDGEKKTFKDDDIKLVIQSCMDILNGNEFQYSNSNLKQKLKNYRELLASNSMPSVTIKLFFVTNGMISSNHKELREVKECTKFNIQPFFVDATSFEKVELPKNGELVVNLKDDKIDKTDSVFSKIDVNYGGGVASCSIKSLMDFYKNTGQRLLLNDNVRYLLKGSTINKEIKASFESDPLKFCFLNNGVSIVCDSYNVRKNALGGSVISFDKPSIVNGGQTVATLFDLYNEDAIRYQEHFEKGSIIIRFYKAPIEFALEIAKATNSQNPINKVDLKANDPFQKIVKSYFEKQGIGFITKMGEEITYFDDFVTNEYMLQVYASLFLEDPAKAKTSKAYVFKHYYGKVFNDSTNDNTCKELFRCYQISKFIIDNVGDGFDKVVVKNSFYSLIYAMRVINPRIMIISIPPDEIYSQFYECIHRAYDVISRIIDKKQRELKARFSLNNLFKGNEIKSLIDIECESLIIND